MSEKHAAIDMGFLSLPTDVQDAVNDHAARRLASEHPCQAFVFGGRGVASDRAPKGMLICYRPDSQKPMAYRGEAWCCGDHQKLVLRQRGETEV